MLISYSSFLFFVSVTFFALFLLGAKSNVCVGGWMDGLQQLLMCECMCASYVHKFTLPSTECGVDDKNMKNI